MSKLKTATGREFDCDYFNPCPSVGQTNLRVQGVSLVDAATIFANPQETVQLGCDGMSAVQYTRLIALVPEDGCIRVVLGKE